MKVYIDTLGCPKNSIDSETAAGLLARAGHGIAETPEEADAILVNTCGFIGDAKEESIDHILEMARQKARGCLLLVSGCLAQRYGAELAAAMPEIDVLLGVNDYARLPEILRECEAGRLPERRLYCGREASVYPELGPRKRLAQPYSAYLRVAEGCDNVCTYCIIPKIRGRFRSRRKEDILAEAKELASQGVKELILVAQDVSAYGIDLYGKYALAELLPALGQIEGIRWIRLMYCYEDRITDELIAAMAAEPKVCRYIDIPIQHADDGILKAMNRRSTRASIEDTLARLRAAMPEIRIRTTLITGFPGERQAQFRALYDFVEKSRFQRLGIFAYSREEGTAAAEMPGQVRRDVKERRREKIMQLQQRISLEYNQALVGRTLEVLVEGIDEEGCYLGRTEYDAPEIDCGVVFRSDRALHPGDFVPVRITDAYDYDLVGEISHESAE